MVGSLADQALVSWAGLSKLLICLTETELFEELSQVISVFSELYEAGKSKKGWLFWVGKEKWVLGFWTLLIQFVSDIDRSWK